MKADAASQIDLHRSRRLAAYAVFALSASVAMGTPRASAADTAAPSVAQGTFEVVMTPNASVDPAISSLSLTKTFTGDLQARSTGQMLGAGDPKTGSAGYVAMERVVGSLAGRHGAFTLQHSGAMSDGTLTATVSVVPGSGIDSLAGLRGTMTISQAGGVHHYVFSYVLRAP